MIEGIAAAFNVHKNDALVKKRLEVLFEFQPFSMQLQLEHTHTRLSFTGYLCGYNIPPEAYYYVPYIT